MAGKDPPIAQALVLFALDTSLVAQFYRRTLTLATIEQEKTHILLRGQGIEVIVHAVPPRVARQIEIAVPPVPRQATPFKPVFVVDDLSRVKQAARETGGHLKPIKSAWNIRGATTLDGWDPEGNIVQFRQLSP